MVTASSVEPAPERLPLALRIPYGALRFLTLPWWTALALLHPKVGREYGIGGWAKLGLLRKLWRNSRQPGSASVFFEHVYMATRLLETPRAIDGGVAEFGCYKGFSTASLSLACALTNRRLTVFDSFEGLPEPDHVVHNFDTGREVPYHRGQYAATLEEVRSNVGRFGDIRVCEFIPGYFDSTLPLRDEDERFVLIFEDADLPASVRSVLRGAWKKLQPGCPFFCHEARDREVVSLFFDRQWWTEAIGEDPPGFIGSGVGMMSGPGLNWCCLGFTVRTGRARMG
jgi:hypothetical protein